MRPVTVFVWNDTKLLVRVFEIEDDATDSRMEATVSRWVGGMQREIGATSEDRIANWQAVYDSRLVVEVSP